MKNSNLAIHNQNPTNLGVQNQNPANLGVQNQRPSNLGVNNQRSPNCFQKLKTFQGDKAKYGANNDDFKSDLSKDTLSIDITDRSYSSKPPIDINTRKSIHMKLSKFDSRSWKRGLGKKSNSSCSHNPNKFKHSNERNIKLKFDPRLNIEENNLDCILLDGDNKSPSVALHDNQNGELNYTKKTSNILNHLQVNFKPKRRSQLIISPKKNDGGTLVKEDDMLEYCKTLQKQDLMNIVSTLHGRSQKENPSMMPAHADQNMHKSANRSSMGKPSLISPRHIKRGSKLSAVSHISRKHLRSATSNNSSFIVKEPEYLAFEEDSAIVENKNENDVSSDDKQDKSSSDEHEKIIPTSKSKTKSDLSSYKFPKIKSKFKKKGKIQVMRSSFDLRNFLKKKHQTLSLSNLKSRSKFMTNTKFTNSKVIDMRRSENFKYDSNTESESKNDNKMVHTPLNDNIAKLHISKNTQFKGMGNKLSQNVDSKCLLDKLKNAIKKESSRGSKRQKPKARNTNVDLNVHRNISHQKYKDVQLNVIKPLNSNKSYAETKNSDMQLDMDDLKCQSVEMKKNTGELSKVSDKNTQPKLKKRSSKSSTIQAPGSNLRIEQSSVSLDHFLKEESVRLNSDSSNFSMESMGIDYESNSISIPDMSNDSQIFWDDDIEREYRNNFKEFVKLEEKQIKLKKIRKRKLKRRKSLERQKVTDLLDDCLEPKGENDNMKYTNNIHFQAMNNEPVGVPTPEQLLPLPANTGDELIKKNSAPFKHENPLDRKFLPRPIRKRASITLSQDKSKALRESFSRPPLMKKVTGGTDVSDLSDEDFKANSLLRKGVTNNLESEKKNNDGVCNSLIDEDGPNLKSHMNSVMNMSLSNASFVDAVRMQKKRGNILKMNLEKYRKNGRRDSINACPSVNDQDDGMTTRSVITIKSNMGHICEVNQYVLTKFLGQGSFGKVYLCRDKRTNRKYAIKILDKKILDWKFIGKSTTAFETIMSEINVMKKLDHQNVVKLIEVIDQEDDNTIYIVMEYVGSMSLSKKMRFNNQVNREPISIREVWQYFRDMVLGIEYCHEVVGVVHRDIKPENLLVTRKGRIKITDFGCSHLIENGTDGLVKTVGSNYYFAPEVCKGQRHKGKPSDIWALGVTLYYMLFNDYPFKAGANEYEVLYDKIINTDPSYSTNIKDKLVVDLLKKMFMKDPEKRITIGEIKDHDWVTGMGKFPLVSTSDPILPPLV